MHGVALAVVFAMPLDRYWCTGLTVMVLAGLVYGLAAQVLFFVPWVWREATWGSNGTWTLKLVSGEQVESRLLSSTFVARKLLVLNFRCGRWWSRAMVILPDSLDADLLRRLRARLRLAPAQGGSGRYPGVT